MPSPSTWSEILRFSEYGLIAHARLIREHLLGGTPSSSKEDGVKFVVVFKEAPKPFWDSKDGVAMVDILDDFATDIFRELHRSLSTTGVTYPRLLRENATRSVCSQESKYTLAAP